MNFRGIPITTTLLLLSLAPLAVAQQQPPQPTVPAPVLGDWFWGTISPTRYWNRDTGEFLGHGYSGSVSYVFEKDGTYKRYFYMETRLGGDVSTVFSASEGTVTFTKDSFTLKPAKGTYRFTEGRSKKRERPMTQDELERPGTTFSWRLEQKDDGKPPVLLVSKAGEEPQTFRRSKD